MDECRAAQTPPQPEGRVVAQTVKITVSQVFDLHTGYARQGYHEFLWLSGWRSALAVFILKLLR